MGVRPVPTDQTITTSLVHPRDRGQTSWWQTTVVCDMPGVYNDESLRSLQEVLPDLAEAGFETLLIRPARPIVEELSFLPAFIGAAHETGLRVVVRAFVMHDNRPLEAGDSPPLLAADEDISEVTTRIRAALEAGADGVDLGLFDIGADDAETMPPESLDEVVNSALSELAGFDDDLLLSAALPAYPHHAFVKNLEEHWFHHLRSSALLEAEWGSTDLRDVISEAYRVRDPLGLATPWRHLLQKPLDSTSARDSQSFGWALSAPPPRYQAMNLFTSALPGSVYLPFVEVGGAVSYADDDAATLRVRFSHDPMNTQRAQSIATALKARRESTLGSSPLAFVDGLPWAADALVLLSGPIMVVLNTSQQKVIVPREHCLIASSGEVGTVVGGATAIPPETCCWFRPADVTPTDPGQYRY